MMKIRDIETLKVVYEAFMASKPTRKDVDMVLTSKGKHPTKKEKAGHGKKR